jgi:DNA-binding NarL/FixJ family response regulator
MDEAVTITVFVVDDHRLFLAGVEKELAEHFDVVGTATDVDEGVDRILPHRPDVTLVDVHIPGGGGVTVVKNVLEREPESRFLALSASDAPDDVIAMIRAGARGYVTKSIGADELVDAVRRIHAGDAVFSPRLAGFVLDAFAGAVDVPSDPELDLLTGREQEVLRLIARGYAYKQVAKRMSISIKTVETHMTSVLRKLQLSNRHELARWASDRRIV